MHSIHNNIDNTIARIGVSLIAFPGEYGGLIAYTIGLQNRGWPELIVLGLPHDYIGPILNAAVVELVSKVSPDKVPEVGMLLTEASNFPMRLGPVSPENVAEHMWQAVFYADRKAEAVPPRPVLGLQLVMCDRQGRFPDDPNFDHAYMDERQPLLG